VTVALVAVTALVPHAARAQETWLPNPGTGDFNTGANWNPASVPNGTAFFGASDTTALTFSTPTTLGGWTFNAGASAYTFSNNQSLSFNGAGIVINGGSASIVNADNLNFNFTSTAANATITNAISGSIDFTGNSTAGHATITNNNNIFFSSTNGAGNATITNDHNIFFSNSTAGSATITSSGTMEFENGSSAGSATITTTTPFGVTNFHDTSTAGTATFTVAGEGVMNFFDQSSADAASIHVDGTSSVNFHDGSTAGTAKIIAGDEGSIDDFAGGFIFFAGNSTADHATITAFGDSNIEFDGASHAGNATLVAGSAIRPPGADTNGFIFFTGTSTAENATITVNQFAELSFAPGFFGGGTATAGNANITNNGNTNFFQGSSAENATITTNDGGLTRFFGESTGGNAQFITNAGGTVDFSGLGTFPDTGAATDPSITGTTAGSIAGAGTYDLGSKQLTVGSNNLSTEVSGVIEGVGGSLVKVGTGTLTLSGNANLGETTIDGGTLAVNGGSLNLGGGVASTQNLIVGQSGIGTLGVQNGGTVTDFGGFVGEFSGSGTLTVSGAGSTWTNTGTIQVGVFGSGMLTIQDGGTVNSGGGGSIGLSPGSTGAVTVTGPGSTWNNSPGGGLNIGSFGAGTLTIANGGTVINNTAFAANIGNGAGSLGTVMVTGAGSTWSNSSGLNIGNSGTGTLTIADSGAVTAGPVVIATNAGAVGTLNIGAGAVSAAAAPGTLTTPSVAFGGGTGTINFNHTSADYVFAPAISGDGTVNVLAGSTTFTGANSYSGATNVEAGTLRAGALNTFSPNSAVMVSGGGTLDLNGFNQTIPGVINAGLVNMGTGTLPGTVLTTASYMGTGGTMAINTVLGGDGSPSDRLVISGGTASGNTTVHVTNVGGVGAETTGNGIQVVSAVSGATTAPGAFALPAGELRAGAFDYDLFRGGASVASQNDWFLRSDFVVPLVPLGPSLPSTPPPNPLPPGVAFPIIGPELATYGVVQPLARQLGLSILGTLDDRVGDTYQSDGCAVASAVAPDSLPTRKGPVPGPCPLFSPSVWGRFFGQTLDNHYSAFADPRASGNLGGFQGGIDLLRGSLIAGHYERAGLYGAYGDVNADVNGLVTNPAATAYVLSHTGSMNLNSWSAGGYWTHIGPGGWYLDAVLQGTWYYGSASTQFARLNTDGTGFIASLEGGYPYSWPQLGPGFVIEPQGQILWQKVSFRHDYDGLGDVALGDTTGPSGRIGLRTKWTIATAGGQVWRSRISGAISGGIGGPRPTPSIRGRTSCRW
jgi:outer membrane autotransporter protein